MFGFRLLCCAAAVLLGSACHQARGEFVSFSSLSDVEFTIFPAVPRANEVIMFRDPFDDRAYGHAHGIACGGDSERIGSPVLSIDRDARVVRVEFTETEEYCVADPLWPSRWVRGTPPPEIYNGLEGTIGPLDPGVWRYVVQHPSPNVKLPTYEFTFTVVPEPASLGVGAMICAALLLRPRRSLRSFDAAATTRCG